MTLAELIEVRGHKFDKEIGVSCSDAWNGYKTGWYWAYRDIKEILEQRGFDTNVELPPLTILDDLGKQMEFVDNMIRPFSDPLKRNIDREIDILKAHGWDGESL